MKKEEAIPEETIKRIYELWPRVVGPFDAGWVEASGLHGRTLIVTVDASVNPYGQKKAVWLERLNKALGARVLEEIMLVDMQKVE